MAHPVCYFEISVNDMDRAVAFYEAVFSLKLERTDIDGNEMALFPEARGTNAITGALARGAS
jgi:predicted enzyme related to lactoylglutathione lyase